MDIPLQGVCIFDNGVVRIEELGGEYSITTRNAPSNNGGSGTGSGTGTVDNGGGDTGNGGSGGGGGNNNPTCTGGQVYVPGIGCI